MGFDPFMKVAFELAKNAQASAIRPNPFVGAVVVNDRNEIIGKGFHKKYGMAHAEVNAINDALSHCSDLRDCTLYVTLEPCSHFGNTPPCTDLIIKNQLKKVVIGSKDLDERVAGIDVLRKAGIETVLQVQDEIIELNNVFFTNKKKSRPFISLKMAMSFDGKIKDASGNSKWISGNASREFVHRNLRMSTDAILTTAKTVVSDNASFNIRLDQHNCLDKDVLVLDRSYSLLETENKSLKLFDSHPNSSIVLIGDQDSHELHSSNIKLIQGKYDDKGSIDLNNLFQQLLKDGYYHILVEAGSYLSTTLFENDLIDELILFVAPFALPNKNAVPLFDSNNQFSIDNSPKFKINEIMQLENDVMIRYVSSWT